MRTRSSTLMPLGIVVHRLELRDAVHLRSVALLVGGCGRRSEVNGHTKNCSPCSVHVYLHHPPWPTTSAHIHIHTNTHTDARASMDPFAKLWESARAPATKEAEAEDSHAQLAKKSSAVLNGLGALLDSQSLPLRAAVVAPSVQGPPDELDIAFAAFNMSPAEPSSNGPEPRRAAHEPTLNEPSLLDLDSGPSMPPVHPLSELERSGYNEYRERANSLFRQGDYEKAAINYARCLNSLPSRHPLRTVALSNLAAAELKTGEHARARMHCEDALQLFPEQIEGPIPGSEPEKRYKDVWSKVVLRWAAALEQLEQFGLAVDAYQLLLDGGVVTDVVLQGRRRAMAAKAPPESTRAPELRTPAKKATATPVESRNSSSLRPSSATPLHEEARLAEARLAEARLAEARLAVQDKVEEVLHSWKQDKEFDIRHLLANLHQVATWTQWTPITTADLVLPKRVKVVFLKAAARTHPDKIPTDLPLQQQMVAEDVFRTLSVAYDKFKRDNSTTTT